MIQTISAVVDWFINLDLSIQLGVIGFILSAFLYVIFLFRWIAKAVKGHRREKIDLIFKVEDVNYEIFKKKGFITFDLYITNHGQAPIEITRAGLVLSDKAEKPFYQEPHVLKRPSAAHLAPGEETLYDNCDLFFALNDKGICYKKVIGFFVDIKDNKRFYGSPDIHPLINDLTIRASLTDKKGMNGF